MLSILIALYYLLLIGWVITYFRYQLGFDVLSTLFMIVVFCGLSTVVLVVLEKFKERAIKIYKDVSANDGNFVLGVHWTFIPIAILWLVLALATGQFSKGIFGVGVIYALYFAFTVVKQKQKEKIPGADPDAPPEWNAAYHEYETAYNELAGHFLSVKPKKIYLRVARQEWLSAVDPQHHPFVDRLITQITEHSYPLQGIPKHPKNFEPIRRSAEMHKQMPDLYRHDVQLCIDKLKEAQRQVEKVKGFLDVAEEHISEIVKRQRTAFSTLNSLKYPSSREEYIPFIDKFLDITFSSAFDKLASNQYSDVAGSMRGEIALQMNYKGYDELSQAGVLKPSRPMAALLAMLLDLKQKKEIRDDEIARADADDEESRARYHVDKVLERTRPTGYKPGYGGSFDDTYFELLRGTGIDKAVLETLSIPKTEVEDLLPWEARFEHHWMVAATGHGKTTALTSLILDDIERVKDGKCSLIVIDSKTELVKKLAKLKVFAKGQPLEGRLVYIDPASDVPLEFNLFERQGLDTESTIETLFYVVSGMIGDDLTAKQSGMFENLIRLLCVMPEPNMAKFLNLMEATSIEEYEKYIVELDDITQRFFRKRYFAKNNPYKATREEVLRRFDGGLSPVFYNMFKSASSKLNLFEEMQYGKVILISTDETKLTSKNSARFGRFFINLIWQATKRRFNDDGAMPTFVYIDEAAAYLNGSAIQELLIKARGARVGMILAHQNFTGMDTDVTNTLKSECNIRMAGGGRTPAQANLIASALGVDAELLRAQPKGGFVTNVAYHYENREVQFEKDRIKPELVMSDGDYKKVLEDIHNRYYRVEGDGDKSDDVKDGDPDPGDDLL